MTAPRPLGALVRYAPGLHRRVAGMTLLERAVLALRRGGVEAVAVVVPAAERAGLEAAVAKGRLREAPPELLEVASGDSALPSWGRDGPRLVLTGPVAIDPTFVTAAREALEQRGVARAVRLAEGVLALPPDAPMPEDPVAGWPDAPLGGTALPVATRADGRRARRALLAQSIKPLEIDGVVCWLLIRRISVRISAVLLSLPVTPNHVTLLSILLGVAAAVFVALGTWPWPVVGGSLLMASLIFDNCDGELARVKFQGSRFGAWLDIYGDFVVNAAFMAGMAVGAWRVFDAPIYLWAGGFALFAFTFYNGTVFRYIHRLGIPDEFLFKWWFDQEAEAAEREAANRGETASAPLAPTAAEAGPSALGRFLSGLKYLGRRDFFIFAYLVTAAFGVLHWAFWATVAGTAMNFVMTCYQVFFWRGLDARR